MKKNITILIGVSLIAIAYTYIADRGAAPVITNKNIEKADGKTSIPAPDFKITSMAAKNYSLNQFRGKAVVLNFWATWCAPCVVELPQMLKLAAANKDSTVFLFLSEDESREDITRFLKKHGINSAQKNVIFAHDKDKHIARELYQTHKLPETFMIDPNGVIREKIIGAIPDWSGAQAQQKIDSLLE